MDFLSFSFFSFPFPSIFFEQQHFDMTLNVPDSHMHDDLSFAPRKFSATGRRPILQDFSKPKG
jgi:hypothetical protein